MCAWLRRCPLRLMRAAALYRDDSELGDVDSHEQQDQQLAGAWCTIFTFGTGSDLTRLRPEQDMDPLAGFAKLSMLSLVGNPVTTKANYRQVVLPIPTAQHAPVC